MEITVGVVLVVVCFLVAAGAGYFMALRHGEVSRIRITVDVPPESTCTETSSSGDNTLTAESEESESTLPANNEDVPSGPTVPSSAQPAPTTLTSTDATPSVSAAASTPVPARRMKPTPKAMPKRSSLGYSKPQIPSQAQYVREIELILPNYDIDPAELLTQLDTVEPIRLFNNRWEYHLDTVTVQLNPQGSLVMSITPTDRK